MKYIELGRSGLRVSKVGLGTWQIGASEWGWNRGYGVEDVVETIVRAHELGVNFIDTAEIYGGGLSEEVVGRAVREFRDEVVIATKVWPTHATYDGVLKACERSLRRLGVDVIDLYQVHWPNPVIPLSSTMRAMERLVELGKVRAIGVSNFSLGRLRRAQECLKREEIVSNQVRYNLVERGVEKELLPYCEREGIALIAYSPLAQGLLTARYSAANRPRDFVRRLNPLFDPSVLRRAEPLMTLLKEIAAKHGAEPGQVALAWLIRREDVVAIPGAKRPEQVESNARAADFELSDDEWSALLEAASKVSAGVWSLLKTPLRLLGI
ncbi:MAG: aldo/keto reductase [Nitrososphaerota archaeon]|nr:aldo/keto reductase [Candidatus Calditenuaceae archaeon]MDW8073466.1 aldo/keto reductase [Nitrososphaerota archaeon]